MLEFGLVHLVFFSETGVLAQLDPIQLSSLFLSLYIYNQLKTFWDIILLIKNVIILFSNKIITLFL
jgi:hypothetical protein